MSRRSYDLIMSWGVDDLGKGVLPLWFRIADHLGLAIKRGMSPRQAQLNERFGADRPTARHSLGRPAIRTVESVSGTAMLPEALGIHRAGVDLVRR